MSNKYLDNYTVEETSPFSAEMLQNKFVMDTFSYAAKQAVSDIRSYWHTEDAQKVVKEDTFCFIWNCFSEKRGELFDFAINKATCSSGDRVKSISKEFCLQFLNDMYQSISVDDKVDTNIIRSRLAAVLDSNFDYLAELTRFSLSDGYSDVYGVWERAALSESRDFHVYDFLWSKVKREAGATDRKQNILNRALKNDALSEALIAKVAKSSPKRLKREVVKGIAESIGTHNRMMRRYEHNLEAAMVELTKEKLDALEKRAMLFVGCNDYVVVESLLDCLSRDNLPWLMPSASEHYWLSQRLSKLIEQSD